MWRAEGGRKEMETKIETETEMEIRIGEIKVGWILVTLLATSVLPDLKNTCM